MVTKTKWLKSLIGPNKVSSKTGDCSLIPQLGFFSHVFPVILWLEVFFLIFKDTLI